MARSGLVVRMGDPFSSKRKIDRVKEQNLFGSGYAGLGGVATLKLGIFDRLRAVFFAEKRRESL
jgi:hypothetical protein